MEYEVIKNYSVVLIFQSLALLLLIRPEFSFILWKNLLKKWSQIQSRRIMKRNRKTEEKLKKYWEVDIRKYK